MKAVTSHIFYMAQAYKNLYVVARLLNVCAESKPEPLFGLRFFSCFDEADAAAKFIAAGKGDYVAGQYINNR